MSDVESDIFHCSKFIGIFLISLQLLGAEAAGVGTCRIHFISIVGKFHHGVRCVESARKCHNHFFLFHSINQFIFS